MLVHGTSSLGLPFDFGVLIGTLALLVLCCARIYPRIVV
jgi:hypothetical protein